MASIRDGLRKSSAKFIGRAKKQMKRSSDKKAPGIDRNVDPTRTVDVATLDVPQQKPQGYAVYQHFYPAPMLSGEMVRVDGNVPQPSKNLLERLIANYQHQMDQSQGASGVWSTIVGHKKPIHDALVVGNKTKLAEFLSDPALSMLMHGFDQPTINSLKNNLTPGMLVHHRAIALGSLRRYAEALGTIPMAYAEGYGQTGDIICNDIFDADDLISAIESELGFQLSFPTPFMNEMGLQTKRGVATYRAIQSLYQGWRLHAVASSVPAGDKPLSALEIGGGTGRTAFFAHMFGIIDYSIVDLPLTGLVQAYFLAMVLGEDKVTLESEAPSVNTIKIFSPPALKDRPFTVTASFDALVEFSREVASDYMSFALRNSGAILSVNRESKSYRVRDLLLDRGLKGTREPYWLRNGYVEEVVQLNSSGSPVIAKEVPSVTDEQSEKIKESRARMARMLKNIHYGLDLDPKGWRTPLMTVRTADTPDLAVAERLVNAFYASKDARGSSGDGLWEFMNNTYHREFGEALETKNLQAVAEILARFFSHPVATGLAARHQDDQIAATDVQTRLQTVDAVSSLGLALGLLRTPNPASGRPPNLFETDSIQTLDEIRKKTGWVLTAPDCASIAGLGYQGGIIHLKQLFQLYAAYRMVEINGGPMGRALEIGGGVGFLAHICARNNLVRDYTILDLPIVNMLQGYFLLKSPIGERVMLFGENEPPEGQPVVRIFPDIALDTLPNGKFDIAVNQDSLPEMAQSTAGNYLSAFSRLVRGHVLSINHESAAPWGNDFEHGIVNELVGDIPALKRVSRHPYWMRGGYVEEVFRVD